MATPDKRALPYTSPFFDSDGDNTAQALSASAGFLYKILAWNVNTSAAYVQLFDAAASDVTVGTTTPNYVVPVPASGGVLDDYVPPMKFSTAISYACTTTATGNGDPSTGLTVSGTFR